MSTLFEKLKQGLQEALEHAKGHTLSGIRVSKISSTPETIDVRTMTDVEFYHASETVLEEHDDALERLTFK